MGTLSTIGILDDGKVTSSVKSRYRDSVVDTVKNGISLGDTNLAGGLISLGDFETGTIDQVISTYPAWNAYYVEGLIDSIANGLDQIPDTGAAFPVLFDPTKPIAIIISELSSIFEPINAILNEPITEVVISQIGVFLDKQEEISGKLEEVVNAIEDGEDAAIAKAEEFFEIIKDAIGEALDNAGENVEDVIEKIDEGKDSISQKIVEIAQNIKDSALSLVPEIPVPSLDLSFLDPSIDTTPLFAIAEVHGQDGIVTKFAKMMTAFLQLPSEIMQAVSDAIKAASEATETILDLVNAIKKIPTDIIQAVSDMLQALLSFIWEKISQIIGINPNAILEISSTINVVIFFVKSFIVSLVGFVLGSGLISLSVARILELV